MLQEAGALEGLLMTLLNVVAGYDDKGGRDAARGRRVGNFDDAVERGC